LKFVTTCSKNEHRKDTKNDAELQTEWKKTTWKTFEGTVRRGRNRSTKAYLVTYDNDDDAVAVGPADDDRCSKDINCKYGMTKNFFVIHFVIDAAK